MTRGASVGAKILVIVLAIWPALTLANGYVAVGGGAGGDADAGNVSIEVGGRSVNHSYNYLGGLGFTAILNAGNVPDSTFDYPVPHWDFTDLGWRQEDNEYGGYALLGLELVPHSSLFVFGIGGVTAAKRIDLAQSNVTGWYYTEDTDHKLYGLYGGGIGFFPTMSRVSLELEYDNRRGWTGLIGYQW